MNDSGGCGGGGDRLGGGLGGEGLGGGPGCGDVKKTLSCCGSSQGWFFFHSSSFRFCRLAGKPPTALAEAMPQSGAKARLRTCQATRAEFCQLRPHRRWRRRWQRRRAGGLRSTISYQVAAETSEAIAQCRHRRWEATHAAGQGIVQAVDLRNRRA